MYLTVAAHKSFPSDEKSFEREIALFSTKWAFGEITSIENKILLNN